LWTEAQGTAVEQGVLDADLFLAVAQSLITGNSNYGQLGQQQQITGLLTAIANLQPAQITLFGSDRVIDFSQFQVRGHYTTSQRLSRYFKAMMWCGLVDFRIAGATNANSLRELSGAVALNQAMSRSAGFQNWQQFDAIVQMFVGAPDSMNFAQLGDLLGASGLAGRPTIPAAVCKPYRTGSCLDSLGYKIFVAAIFGPPSHANKSSCLARSLSWGSALLWTVGRKARWSLTTLFGTKTAFPVSRTK
jgi:hypothetical protein